MLKHLQFFIQFLVVLIGTDLLTEGKTQIWLNGIPADRIVNRGLELLMQQNPNTTYKLVDILNMNENVIKNGNGTTGFSIQVDETGPNSTVEKKKMYLKINITSNNYTSAEIEPFEVMTESTIRTGSRFLFGWLYK